MNATVERSIVLPEVRERKDRAIAMTSDQPPSLLTIIGQVCTGPNANVEIAERLVALYNQQEDRARDEARRQRDEIAQGSFNRSMVSCQAEMLPIAKDASNPQTRSKYASYEAIDRVLRPIYSKYGFALMFGELPSEPGWLNEYVDVIHSDGCTKRYTIRMAADGKGAKGGDVMTLTHAIGAAKTYARRYLIKDVFNVAIGEKDNDVRTDTAVRISEKQAMDLGALITELGGNVDKLKRYWKIDALTDIPVKNLEAVIKDVRAFAKQAQESRR